MFGGGAVLGRCSWHAGTSFPFHGRRPMTFPRCGKHHRPLTRRSSAARSAQLRFAFHLAPSSTPCQVPTAPPEYIFGGRREIVNAYGDQNVCSEKEKQSNQKDKTHRKCRANLSRRKSTCCRANLWGCLDSCLGKPRPTWPEILHVQSALNLRSRFKNQN